MCCVVCFFRSVLFVLNLLLLLCFSFSLRFERTPVRSLRFRAENQTNCNHLGSSKTPPQPVHGRPTVPTYPLPRPFLPSPCHAGHGRVTATPQAAWLRPPHPLLLHVHLHG